MGTQRTKASTQREETERQMSRREILQCVAGFLGLIVFVLLYTWAVPGWWAAF